MAFVLSLRNKKINIISCWKQLKNERKFKKARQKNTSSPHTCLSLHKLFRFFCVVLFFLLRTFSNGINNWINTRHKQKINKTNKVSNRIHVIEGISFFLPRKIRNKFEYHCVSGNVYVNIPNNGENSLIKNKMKK